MRASLILLVLAVPALPGDDALERRCAELAAGIEKLLGPKFTEPVPVRVVDSEFIAKFAADTEEKQVPPEIRELNERLFVRFKLVPEGFDLMKAQLDLLRASVAGLYDPDKDCFYIVGGKARPGTAEFDVTAAHELAHAYRDVDKDYWKRVVASFLVDEDRAIAISCLVEGDAQLIGEAVGGGVREEKALLALIANSKRLPEYVPAALSNPALRPFPLYLREMLITRYLIGQAFAAHVFEKGGWPALDAAFDAPPVSTEQILHPEKYLGPKVDKPTRIEGGDPAAALGDGWKTVYRNSAGEFMFRLHFTESLGRKQATVAAEGWDGGRYFICERQGAPLFAGMVTVWDSEKDAAEFARAWLDWASIRDDPKNRVIRDRVIRDRADSGEGREQTADGLVVVRTTGTRVLVADGVPADRVDAVMKALGSAKLIP